MAQNQVTARDVDALIRRQYLGRFWSEVGVAGGNRRLDLVRVDNGVITVYEIKVDRQDFRGDNKWPDYLPYCHRFYFVGPEEVFLDTDHPCMDTSDVGLLVLRRREYARRQVSRLVTSRSARKRPMDPADEARLLHQLIERRSRT